MSADPVREKIQGFDLPSDAECGQCGYPFDAHDLAWWSESMGHYYCSKGCYRAASDRAELRAEHGPFGD